MLTSHPVQKHAATKRLLGAATIRCVVAHCCANAVLYCKVDTAVQREHIEHVRVTEGVEYMHTLAWGWATFFSGRWPIVRYTREGVSHA